MIREAAHALAGLALILLAGLPGPARSAQFEVGIEFELAAPSITDAWPEDMTKRIAAEIHENLIVYMNANFPFWKTDALWLFGGDFSPTPVVLRFEVVEANNFTKFKLIPSFEGVQDRPEGLAPVDWLKPGDQPPGMASAADVITARIVERLLEEVKYRKILDDWLQDTVPIAVGAQWDQTADDLRLVLPLEWNEYRMLRRSVFRLDCRTPNHHPVELESHAIPIRGRFQPRNDVPFDALVVAPVQQRLFGNVASVDQLNPDELRRLQFGAIYLIKYEKPGFDDTWAIAPSGDQL